MLTLATVGAHVSHRGITMHSGTLGACHAYSEPVRHPCIMRKQQHWWVLAGIQTGLDGLTRGQHATSSALDLPVPHESKGVILPADLVTCGQVQSLTELQQSRLRV